MQDVDASGYRSYEHHPLPDALVQELELLVVLTPIRYLLLREAHHVHTSIGRQLTEQLLEFVLVRIILTMTTRIRKSLLTVFSPMENCENCSERSPCSRRGGAAGVWAAKVGMGDATDSMISPVTGRPLSSVKRPRSITIRVSAELNAAASSQASDHMFATSRDVESNSLRDQL
jgi:hypothetical protein